MVLARKHLISLISNCYKTSKWKTESVHLFFILKSAGLRLVCSSSSCTHACAHTWLNKTRREQRIYSCNKSIAFSGHRDPEDSGHSVKTQIQTFFAAPLVYLPMLFVYLLIFLLHISSWLAFPKEVEFPCAGQFCMFFSLHRVYSLNGKGRCPWSPLSLC